MNGPTVARILFVARRYLDPFDGDAVAGRRVTGALARWGFDVEVLCRDAGETHSDPGERAAVAAPDGASDPPRRRLNVRGVSVVLHQHGATAASSEPDDNERGAFLRLFEAVVERDRPDVVWTIGDGRLVREVLAAARRRGIATVLMARGLGHRDPNLFADVDAVLVPTRFLADYYREALGLRCAVLPIPVDHERTRAERVGPGYVTFIDPTPENGVYALARIADELGRLRPDVPLLVVEGKGTEADLAGCGLDLPARGNVSLMAPPADRRKVWEAAQVCLLPTVGWDDPSTTAAEALVNGVPVVASDRAGLPETLGEAGVTLPLPDGLTTASRIPPTAEEVSPWVEAIIRLWDDRGFADEHRRKASAEARRRDAEGLGSRYARFLADLGSGPVVAGPFPGRSRSVVLVPHLNGIDWECEQGLRRLEQSGVKVVRRGGSSAIDMARNVLFSDALHDGFESMMFIDADIGFDPLDVLRLLARPEPVVCGVYAKKGRRALANHFADGVAEVLFGPDAPRLYPVRFAATGFLRVKAAVLRKLIEELKLPLCNTKWGRGVWPFFLPLIVPHDGDKLHYLGEDWAFSHRLGRIGVTPLADTSVRLWHWGRYGYGWEDAGADVARYRSYNYRLGGR